MPLSASSLAGSMKSFGRGVLRRCIRSSCRLGGAASPSAVNVLNGSQGATRPVRRRNPAVSVLAALPLLLACGCSTFSRDWKQATLRPTPPDSIAGRWEGQWLSEVNGHRGRLRCLIALEGENRCAARFQATYAKIFRFSYTVTLRLQAHDGGWEFNGDEDLGKLAGGVYHYEGRASPTKFYSTYRSGRDHGVFEMHRPE